MEVLLTEWYNHDAGPLVKIANNINIWKNVRDSFPHPYTKMDAEEWISSQQGKTSLENSAIRVDGSLCGGMRIMIQEDIHRCTAEIGYFIGEEYWNRGIATKAILLMTEYAFSNFDIVRIYAGVFDKNKSSMRVLEKSGFHTATSRSLPSASGSTPATA